MIKQAQEPNLKTQKILNVARPENAKMNLALRQVAAYGRIESKPAAQSWPELNDLFRRFSEEGVLNVTD